MWRVTASAKMRNIQAFGGPDNQTRQPALAFGWISVVPPRRIFSRFDKLDVMFLDFLHFALIVEALR